MSFSLNTLLSPNWFYSLSHRQDNLSTVAVGLPLQRQDLPGSLPYRGGWNRKENTHELQIVLLRGKREAEEGKKGIKKGEEGKERGREREKEYECIYTEPGSTLILPSKESRTQTCQNFVISLIG